MASLSFGGVVFAVFVGLSCLSAPTAGLAAKELERHSNVDTGSSTGSSLVSSTPQGEAGHVSDRQLATVADASSPPGTVSLLLQLTDIHLSAMAPPAGDPQRGPDVLELSSELLARWPLAAAVLTGDLTEAKDVYGRSRQDEREWQEYLSTWKALASVSGVPEGQIYDTRGNHDTFNSGSRCGTKDYYCLYSARALRPGSQGNGTASAVAAAAATAASVVAAPAAAGTQGPWGRVFVDPVYGDMSNTSGVCPVAMVVGIDAALDPGLRSPMNFLGVVTADVLDQLDEQLEASVAGMRAAGCSPPYIAYGHYPLSVMAYPGRRSPAGASIQDVLVRHGVSVYLAGHLHGAFGRRLHRLHTAKPPARGTALPNQPTGHLLELEMVDWKYGRTVRLLTLDSAPGGAVVGFQDFRYRPPPGPSLQARTAGRRRMWATRMNASDPAEVDGAAPRVGAPLEPFDSTATLGTYLPLITCPPDARYSPQVTTVQTRGAGGCSGGNLATSRTDSDSATAVVRVLVLPVTPAAPAVPSEPVYVHWWCGAGSDGAHADGQLSGFVQMNLESSAANHSIFTADLLGADAPGGTSAAEPLAAAASSELRACPLGLLVVQVRIGGVGGVSDGGTGGASTSAKRTLRWRPPAPPPPSSSTSSAPPPSSSSPASSPPPPCQDAFWQDADADGSRACTENAPVPLRLTAVEWLVMHVPWHRFGQFAFLAQWSIVTLGLLALPRVLAVWRARRAHSQGPGRVQGRGANARLGGWQQPRPASRSPGCAGCEEADRKAALEDRGLAAAGEAGMVSRAYRDVGSAVEGASTSVRLGGGGVLKRSNSGSSSAQEDVDAAWSVGSAGAGSGASRRVVPQGPVRGGGGAGSEGREAAGGGGAWRAVSHMVLQWLLWPVRDFAELADHRDSVPWLALLLFAAYLAVGPWLAAELVEADGGPWPLWTGYGILTAHGIYMRPLLAPAAQAPLGGISIAVAPSQDHVVIENVVFLTCAAPTLLLCASAAARLRRCVVPGKPSTSGNCGEGALWRLLSWRQGAALCVIAVINLLLSWKLWAGMGWTPVLLSPGLGWLLPLVGAWWCLTTTRARSIAVRGSARETAMRSTGAGAVP